MNNLEEPSFDYITKIHANNFLESQSEFQSNKRLSISSLDEDLYVSIQLPQIHNITACLMEVLNNRNLVIGFILKNEIYLNNLQKTFEDLEDIEDTEGLQSIFEIIKHLSTFFNSFQLRRQYNRNLHELEILQPNPGGLRMQFLNLDDPSNFKQIKHRKFMNEKAHWCLEDLLKDSELKNIIQLNYRLQYLRDCVIAYVVDEQLQNTLQSIIYYQNQDILTAINERDDFFPSLLNAYEMENAIDFTQEYLNISKTIIHQEIRQKSIQIMTQHDVFSDIFLFFLQNKENRKVIIKILNIFQTIQIIDVNFLPKYILDREMSQEIMDTFLYTLLNFDSGIISTVLELFKELTDMQVQKRYQIIDALFYKLIQPAISELDGLPKSQLITVIDFITELFIYSQIKHGFKLRGYLIQQKIIQQLAKFISLQNKNINLSLIKLLKKIILQNDEIMIKYLYQNDIIPQFFSIFVKLKQKNNIIYSCFLELLYFTFTKNLSKVISGIFEKYYREPIKENIWEKLKKKYEQQNDFNPLEDTIAQPETTLVENTQAKTMDNSFRRQLECEEEESYFSEQDSLKEEISNNSSGPNHQKMVELSLKISQKTKDEEQQFQLKKQTQQQLLSKPKSSFSFSLSLGQDTFKKVKMDSDL